MNWDAIGAVGEVVGAFTMAFSLVYLAVQIRQSLKMVEDSAFWETFAAISTQFTALCEGPNAESFLKGLVDFGGQIEKANPAYD